VGIRHVSTLLLVWASPSILARARNPPSTSCTLTIIQVERRPAPTSSDPHSRPLQALLLRPRSAISSPSRTSPQGAKCPRKPKAPRAKPDSQSSQEEGQGGKVLAIRRTGHHWGCRERPEPQSNLQPGLRRARRRLAFYITQCHPPAARRRRLARNSQPPPTTLISTSTIHRHRHRLSPNGLDTACLSTNPLCKRARSFSYRACQLVHQPRGEKRTATTRV
jgi:hypothetical protein